MATISTTSLEVLRQMKVQATERYKNIIERANNIAAQFEQEASQCEQEITAIDESIAVAEAGQAPPQ